MALFLPMKGMMFAAILTLLITVRGKAPRYAISGNMFLSDFIYQAFQLPHVLKMIMVGIDAA